MPTTMTVTTHKNNSKHDGFFEDWKVGNWCWERDYSKYPVSSSNCHENDCMNDKSNSSNEEMRTIDKACDDEKKPAAIVSSSSSSSGSSDKISSNNSNKERIAAEHKLCGEDGRCGGGGGGGGCDDGNDKNGTDDDDDEKKPAAIKSSSCSSDCVATTAAMEIAATNNRNVREEFSKSSSRCPQIKAEKNYNENEDTNNINVRCNNNENDDSFYDDWVEGNWCLLDNNDNNNNNNNNNHGEGEGEGEGEGDDNNSIHKIRHGMTTRSRKRTRNEDNMNDDSTERKSKRFRFHQDNDDDDDDDGEEEEEEEESYNEEEEYEGNSDGREEEDSNDVQNHQEDNRPARKRLRPLQIQDDQIWMAIFEKLVEYKKQHKNTIVPQRYDEHSQIVGCTKLGSWVNNQRTSYRNNKLLPNRIDLLNSIGFEWDGVKSATDQIKWMNMFEKLVQYKKQHKDTKVSKRDDEHSQIVGCTKLGSWVATQRTGYRNNKLLPNRIDLLDSIGFDWEGVKSATYQIKWMNMFQKLVAYKEKHKDTKVSKRYKEDPKLGNWVSTQRIAYKSYELFPKRLALLNSVGFDWAGVVGGKVNNEKWMDLFQKLSAYKKQHKNTAVPKEYNKDPKLGRWVSKQRHFYNYSELHPERLALLYSIDFN
jgi:hypothetical protein